MNAFRPQCAARLVPTVVGLMYVRATPAGISGLVRAGTGPEDDDETGALPAGDPDKSRTDQQSVGDHPADERVAVDEANQHLDRLSGQLDDYFDGRLCDFTVPVDWAAAGVEPGFGREVYREIQHIPYGETISYGQISIDAGRPRNARRVGRLCSLVPVSFLIPVHRVTRADGGLGSCPEFRRHLLAHERRNIDSAEPVAIVPE